MSVLHTWSGCEIGTFRSKYGNTRWPGDGFDVFRFGTTPAIAINRCTRLRFTSQPSFTHTAGTLREPLLGLSR